MATVVDKRLYQSVSAYSSATDEQIVDNGEKFIVYCVGGNACYDTQVKVEVLFDTTVIFSTHGEDQQDERTGLYEGTGDGSKKLKIKLTNDSASAETIGGYYKAVAL
jgi:hypothetical protein